jgi:RNA polymerase sigma-70 factor (ECF subfamily)
MLKPLRKRADHFVPSPAARALALNLVTEFDLLRLKTIARLYARGLPPDVDWGDLIQEAIARVLSGARRQPEGVTTIVFLAGVMRSLRTAYLRRARTGAGPLREKSLEQAAAAAAGEDASRIDEPRDPAPDPEHAVSALQEIAAIECLFGGDAMVLRIIHGLAEGLSAEQIRSAYGITAVDYDSARKRMRRVLLREGLTCGNL